MENQVNLKPKEIFSFSWAGAKKNLLAFFIVFVAYIILNAIAPEQNNKNSFSFVRFLGSLISILGSMYLGVTVSYGVLSIARGRDVQISSFFFWPKNGLKSLWAGIVSGIIVAGIAMLAYFPLATMLVSGFLNKNILLIIFGFISIAAFTVFFIYVVTRLYFVKFYALETGAGAVDSIKKSIELTKNSTWKIVWIMVLSVGIIILGAIALFVGLLWAIPTVMISYAYIYTRLLPNFSNPESEIVVQPVELTQGTSEKVDSISNNSDI